MPEIEEALTGKHARIEPGIKNGQWTKLLQAPGPYDGECNSEEWLDEAIRFSKLSEIPLEYIIQAKLKGSARSRWEADKKENENSETKFRRLFTKDLPFVQQFGDVLGMQRRVGEDFAVFYHRLETAVNRLFDNNVMSKVNMHRELLIANCGMSTLKEKCALKPEMSRASILEMGKTLTKLEVSPINIIEPKVDGTASNNKPPVTIQQQVNTLSEQISAMQRSYANVVRSNNTPMYSNQRPPLHNRQRPPFVQQQRQPTSYYPGAQSTNQTSPTEGPPISRRSSPPTCYHCGESGHIRRFCPSLQCYCCRQFGHLSMDCQQTRQNSRGTTNYGGANRIPKVAYIHPDTPEEYLQALNSQDVSGSTGNPEVSSLSVGTKRQ